MEQQSAREPLLDVEKVETVENEDEIHEQNGKFLCGVCRASVVPVIFSDIRLFRLPMNRTNTRFRSSWIIAGCGNI
jgi:hypothetical protein